MRVLVAGATGLLGRQVVRALKTRGHQVIALVRDPGRLTEAEVEVWVGDLTHPASLRGACDAVDVVISAAGASVQPFPIRPETTFEATDRDGNLALLAEAEYAGVPRFVYLSVYGEYPEGMGYVDAHRAVEAALDTSGIEAVVIRPTGYFSALGALLDLARLPVAMVVGRGTARSNPIDDRDLAEVVADAVQGAPSRVDVGGPEVLARRDMVRAAYTARGRRGWIMPFPAFLPRLVVPLVRLVNRRIGDLLAFYLHVMTHDCVAPAHGHRLLVDAFRERLED